MSLIAIIFGTFVSEDLTCIAVGLLISRHQLDPASGTIGCYLGILVGDFGLWLVGRIMGEMVFGLRWLRGRMPVGGLETAARWFDGHGWKIVLAARCVPGTRLPMYVAAGALGRRAGRFLVWASLAGLLWTPMLVGAVVLFGPAVVQMGERVLGGASVALGAAAFALLAVMRLPGLVSTPERRARCLARAARIWRWEFWPAWLFYSPVVPYIGWLALWNRGLATITAANPGIPHGGIVGESKHEILRRLPAEWVVPTHLLAPGDAADRVRSLKALLSAGWSFPLILKPDVGERGAGVRLVRDIDSACAYVRTFADALLVQAYHPGPFEAGIFYYRIPGDPCGRILSITDKRFPVVVGDGSATLAELIWRHPRYRMQARTFLARLNGNASTVLRTGTQFSLAMAGNHCQGTLFRDGRHLWTPALEACIDEIAQQFAGFFFGRFDVRYSDVEAFQAGRGFQIVELNGASSEATDLYDPAHSLWNAYSTLCRQWRLLFEIGSRNRDLGHPVTPTTRLWSAIRSHYRNRRVSPLAD